MRYIFCITIVLFFYAHNVQAQNPIKGKVIDSLSQEPIAGATVILQEGELYVKTDGYGLFQINTNKSKVKLMVSALGYNTRHLLLSVPREEPLVIRMEKDTFALEEVEVVSTGYQQLPKERVTGSFEVVGNELLNRRVSTNLIDRLEDVTPGLVFNRNRGSASLFNIRGQSGIFSNAQPLIVIDNFVYDGDLSNINPNDVESITVLKDAAAASIWGARAGNGVVVITTKRGKIDQSPQVSFNSNVTFGGKPNVFYLPRMSSSDFIEVEKNLFLNNYYRSAELSASKTPLTPVVELLIAARDGLIEESEASSQIEALKQVDVRNDLEKYFYRNSLNQQYALNVNGGGNQHQYFYSAGFDNEEHHLKANGKSRITLNAANNFQIFSSRLNLKTDIYYTHNHTTRDRGIPFVDDIGLVAGNQFSIFPYAKLADENGNALPINRDYRSTFIQSQEDTGLLDWHYRPLEELHMADYNTKIIDYRLNTQLRYDILSGLSVDLLYQFGQTLSESHHRQGVETYFTRNLINRYSQPRGDGNFDCPIPIGDILDKSYGTANNHNIRAQVNYNLTKGNHDVIALAGYEIKDYNRFVNNYREYGYDDDLATVKKVDFISPFPQYHNNSLKSVIPFGDSASDITDRFLSYFGNAAYTYKNRYTASASARFDRSNLFGVKTNQQGVPLWSVGGMWIISKEDFYNMDRLPVLKLRWTYGYNGNIDKSITAFTTAMYNSTNYLIPVPYAGIISSPNPELRWERIKTVNIGLDFQVRNNRIGGSIDLYSKKGVDLIGDMTLRPSVGRTAFRGNYAETRTKGVDISLHSRNLTGKLGWNTHFIVSAISDKVTNYELVSTSTAYATDGDWGQRPMVGKPLFSVYSFKWGGLDETTGSPQGYLQNELSQDYAKIISTTNPEELIYHGPSRPSFFGAFRNTFTYGHFSLSANISFRLGYYFRLNGINYYNIQTAQGYQNGADYSLRWQKAGDEKHTHVPSIPASININRDNFYRNSEALVERGDHIRLQDIRLEYRIGNKHSTSSPFKNMNVFVYGNNLGLLWKKTGSGFDPDYILTMPPSRTIALGFSLSL